MAFRGFAFLDTETTGLEPQSDAVLEVGIVLTDEDLVEVDSQYWITKTKPAVAAMDFLYRRDDESAVYVQNMHNKSGLKEEFDAANTFDRLVYVQEMRTWLYDRDADKMPMCGSSIGFDRGFMSTHYPEINNLFHYRNVDVSTFKEFFRATRLGLSMQIEDRIKAVTGPGEAEHRTVADCRWSIASLHAYSTYGMLPK